MTAIDPRTPVLVGAGQFLQKPANPADALEPAAMMAQALRQAADNAGSPRLLAAADAIRVVFGSWPYHDPGRVIADLLGISPRQSALTTEGGNTPQSLVNQACLDVQAGRLDVVLLVGGEGIWSRRRARLAGQRVPYTDDSSKPRAEVIGKELAMSSELELAAGFKMPVNVYPLFEVALRHAQGERVAQHRERVSELWARFNAVAVDNPYAWLRTPLSAEQIRTPSDTNRMVGFPYTKSMNSNWDLDQAAGIIVCSAAQAEALGVARERWVFPWAGTDAHDTYLFSNRDNFHSSPAIRIAGRACLELAGVGVDDLAHVDLYSCFPSAVQIAANELGLDQSRQLTLTGGLPFAGGPLNNYVMHSIATMADVLRENPADVGLISANGGYVTKHAIGVYSTQPPPQPFRHRDVQDEVDRFPTREVTRSPHGPAKIESYTVMHDHTGPVEALVSVLLPDQRRAFARSGETSLMTALMAEEFCGRSAEIDGSGVFQA